MGRRDQLVRLPNEHAQPIGYAYRDPIICFQSSGVCFPLGRFQEKCYGNDCAIRKPIEVSIVIPKSTCGKNF